MWAGEPWELTSWIDFPGTALSTGLSGCLSSPDRHGDGLYFIAKVEERIMLTPWAAPSARFYYFYDFLAQP